MIASTRFLSRLIGLYCLLAALVMALHRESMLMTVTALVHDAPLLFLVGILTLLAGLAWVLVHNRWTGGGEAVLLTVLGWITVLKGLLFLTLSPEQAPGFYLGTLHYAQMFYVYAALSGLIGAYLCYRGFFADHPRT